MKKAQQLPPPRCPIRMSYEAEAHRVVDHPAGAAVEVYCVGKQNSLQRKMLNERLVLLGESVRQTVLALTHWAGLPSPHSGWQILRVFEILGYYPPAEISGCCSPVSAALSAVLVLERERISVYAFGIGRPKRNAATHPPRR